MCESMSKRKTATPSIDQSVIQSVLYYDMVCTLLVIIGCFKSTGSYFIHMRVILCIYNNVAMYCIILFPVQCSSISNVSRL